MADGAPNNTMNLDLNSGPGLMPGLDLNLGPGSTLEEDLNEWMDSPSRIREAVEAGRRTGRQRRRWRNSEEDLWEFEIEYSLSSSRFGTGVGVEGQDSEVEKARENKWDKAGVEEEHDEAMGGKEEDGKGSGDDGSLYDCNICFEMAKDPVITCCGHLYCWPCIYRWLHDHSDAQACPVCKGEVVTENVTPLYGRGQSNRAQEEDLTLRIPPRPSAKRVESEQMNTSTTRMEEMLRRLGTRDMQTAAAAAAIPHDGNLPHPRRTTRGWRRRGILALQEATTADLVASHYGSRRHPRLDGRGVANRPVSATSHRDSFPGIAGSQITDTAVEFVEVVELEPVESESVVDSRDSRPPRRRRRN